MRENAWDGEIVSGDNSLTNRPFTKTKILIHPHKTREYETFVESRSLRSGIRALSNGVVVEKEIVTAHRPRSRVPVFVRGASGSGIVILIV